MPTPPNPQQTEDTAYYRQTLHDLIDLGTDLARRVHAAAAAEGPTPEHVLTFDRIARAVRRTILLARKVAEPLPTPPDPARQREAARKQIIRNVEDIIGHTRPNQAGKLEAELHERLDSPDLDDDIATRPLDEIIAEIRRDLGLENTESFTPHKRRTPEDLAQLLARAATAGSQKAPASPSPACGRGSG